MKKSAKCKDCGKSTCKCDDMPKKGAKGSGKKWPFQPFGGKSKK